MFLAEGNLFQQEGCPYLLSRRQAEQVTNDDSKVGNTITLVTHGGGERCSRKYCCNEGTAVYVKVDVMAGLFTLTCAGC